MKKLVLMFVAIAAISFASCGGNNKPVEAPEVDTVEVADTVPADTVAPADTVVAE